MAGGSAAREEKIMQARLRQPLPELDRKARKACTRSNVWTQEEIDAAKTWAKEAANWFETHWH